MKPVLLSCLALALPAFGVLAPPPVELGDPAAALQVSAWIRGDPVDLSQRKGKVTVVEFWATWCPTCVACIPHLTELQRKFQPKGVQFVGVSREKPEELKPFVEKMGDKMGYAVAADDDDDKTSKAYMSAFGIGAIPHAFIVDAEGRVVWHGLPTGELDEALNQILAKTFSFSEDKKAAVAGGLSRQYLASAMSGKAEAGELKALGEKVLKAGAKDPQLLSSFAWRILTVDRIQQKDFVLALAAAKAANAASGGRDARILNTLAMALNENGKAAEAVATGYQALAQCKEGDAKLKSQIEEALTHYQQKAQGGR